MHVLVFGRTGQVGVELARLASADLKITTLGREEVALTDPEGCAWWIRNTDADVVINAAAYTFVDKAEAEPELAMAVNGVAPRLMAEAALSRDVPFVHLSTDYVFDGTKLGAWTENDPVAPLGAYGRSKLAGEQAIRLAHEHGHVIVRTAWVFSAHGKNFLKSVIRMGADRDRLFVVDDQTGGPTPASAIAEALIRICNYFVSGRGVTGTFHFAGSPKTTWHGFAREIFSVASTLDGPEIIPIATEQWKTAAPRPANSVLDCSRIRNVYGIHQPDWRQAVTEVLRDLRQAA